MAKVTLNLTITLICLHLIYLRVLGDYTAAVVEFFPEQNRHLSPEERLSKNIDGYIGVLDQLSQTSKIDIIVYPEMTLSENAPVTRHSDLLPYSAEVEVSEASLCKGSVSNLLTPLACAAVKYKTYMVVNLYEKSPCKETDCPSDGWSLYNTNVVFDRNGAVVSKYRKYNLFAETYVTQPKEPDYAIFRTDFNETFAMFICFDILFRRPSLDLVKVYEARSVLYPTMWFSELPFLTALQAQQQWAYATDVTFLASGANNGRLGSGGTGIYRGTEGPLTFTIVGRDESRGLVANIPGAARKPTDTLAVDRKAREMDGFLLLSDHLKGYASKPVQPYQIQQSATVCSRAGGAKFCCHFKIKTEWQRNDRKNQYRYHMVAFSGVRSFSGAGNGGLEVCAVVACRNESLSSCGKRFPDYSTIFWPATFKRMVIKASFDVDDNKFQFPNSLLSNIEPIATDAFEWTSTIDEKQVHRTYTLKKPQSRLMTFGIYGRDFNRDSSVPRVPRQIFY